MLLLFINEIFTMKNGLKIVVMVTLLMQAIGVFAEFDDSSLSGFWQHESEPAVVEIVKQGEVSQGIVRKQEQRPQVIGRNLFSDLVFNPSEGNWTGRIFVMRLNDEKDVTITQQSEDHFEMVVKVGFISRSAQWNRVAPQDI